MGTPTSSREPHDPGSRFDLNSGPVATRCGGRRGRSIVDDPDLDDLSPSIELTAHRPVEFCVDPILEHALSNLLEGWQMTGDGFVDPHEMGSEGRFDWSRPLSDAYFGESLRKDRAESRHDSSGRGLTQSMPR